MTYDFIAPAEGSQSYLLWHAMYTWRHNAPLHKSNRHGRDDWSELFNAELERHEQIEYGRLR